MNTNLYRSFVTPQGMRFAKHNTSTMGQDAVPCQQKYTSRVSVLTRACSLSEHNRLEPTTSLIFQTTLDDRSRRAATPAATLSAHVISLQIPDRLRCPA